MPWDWIAIAKLLLGIVQWTMRRADENRSIKAGQDAEIAKQTVAILRMTDAGKKLMERIDAMSSDELDNLFDEFGADGPSGGPK